MIHGEQNLNLLNNLQSVVNQRYVEVIKHADVLNKLKAEYQNGNSYLYRPGRQEPDSDPAAHEAALNPKTTKCPAACDPFHSGTRKLNWQLIN